MTALPLSQALVHAIGHRHLLLLGFGREGRSTLRFIARYRSQLQPQSVTVADRSPLDPAAVAALDPEARLVSGTDYLDAIHAADYVFKSPGISLRDYTDQWLGEGRLGTWPRAVIGGQIDLLLRFHPCRLLIGITGTKGKTTTATLTAAMLHEAGITAPLIGNIGVPVLDSWETLGPEVVPVVELSSHQLQFAWGSPQLAAITNFYPEHLDHYRSYDEYRDAKLNILRFQNTEGLFARNGADRDLVCRSTLLVRGRVRDLTAADGAPYLGLHDALKGPHHALDMALAACLATAAGADDAAIRRAIRGFETIPHRCEPLGIWSGIHFYNDSIATIPAATELAIQTLGNVDTLIVGGMDRGLDLTDFVDRLLASDIANIICLPDTGRAIHAKLDTQSPGRSILVETLEEAVAVAFSRTAAGRACLLSPAASSYHRWRSFEERGDEFRELVARYGERASTSGP
ncbi:MAG: UDP-N-acetylmuramoyl-L-alanine--D-glutamate ligase [Bacillota bacterium]|nr:UDP-N-acetylmuramoyl-L-alanine--D-glutamate ligase [Bacillota bacterium]